MNEETQPGRTPGRPVDTLPQALEELIARRESSGLGEVAGATPGADARECLQAQDWLDLMRFEAGSSVADEALAHLSGCAVCAEQARILFGDASAEEVATTGGMQSNSPTWRRDLAGRLARTPAEGTRKTSRVWYLWGGSALAAMLLIGAVLTFWWRFANTPERLLAEVYSHARIFELRMPGAGFAEVTPVRHLRSAGSAHPPKKLLEARAQIESQLNRNPENEHWLQLEARTDVLQENFDPAIEILNRLLASGPPTASLLADDAAAYYERGVETGNESDRSTALGYLRQADALAPGNAIILFNEAVVMEDEGQSMSAVETWNRYLSFERDPRWLAEGRRRLARLEEKLKKIKSLEDGGK